MNAHIPFQKRSKKAQRALNAKKRGSWNGVNPVTRKTENAKAYNRRKARKWTDDSITVSFSFYNRRGKTETISKGAKYEAIQLAG